MSKTLLQEYISPLNGNIIAESLSEAGDKHWYMKGILVQGDVRNQNNRIYPVREISNAVSELTSMISKNKGGVLGELDHPAGFTINLDRASHLITKVAMEGPNGVGTLKILSTPMGKIIQSMLADGVCLGVSSRGTGNVNESTGHVSEFEIVTIDIVAQPSAPQAVPVPIFEGIMNMNGGANGIKMIAEAHGDKRVQTFIKKLVLNTIKDMKL